MSTHKVDLVEKLEKISGYPKLFGAMIIVGLQPRQKFVTRDNSDISIYIVHYNDKYPSLPFDTDKTKRIEMSQSGTNWMSSKR